MFYWMECNVGVYRVRVDLEKYIVFLLSLYLEVISMKIIKIIVYNQGEKIGKAKCAIRITAANKSEVIACGNRT